MKKIKVTIGVLAFFIGIIASNFVYAQGNIRVMYNGSQMTFDVNPYMRASRTLVPFRKILETLGASISWDNTTNTVTAKKGSTEIKLKIGNNKAVINGRNVPLDVAPELNSGRTFVPLRFVSENLGANVKWDGNTNSIYIVYPVQQVVISHVDSGSYESVSVKKGIPLKLVLRVNKTEDISGCNSTVIIPKYQILKRLTVGDNVIEFTPTEAGIIPFSCGMGMIQSSINVLAN